jgi:single-strand DNA-binding protein
MATLNEVRLIGNLTKDPDSRAAGSHTIVSFSIAVNRKSKGADGQATEEVSFFDCDAWNKTGDLVMQYCKKGRQVLVLGRLKQERWEKDGQKRSKVKIIADNVQFLGAKPEGEAGDGGQPQEAGIGDPDVAF